MSKNELSDSGNSYEAIQDEEIKEDFINLSANSLQDLLNSHFDDFIDQTYHLSICCENLACFLVDKLELLQKEAECKGFSTFKDIILKNPQTLSNALSNQNAINMLASSSVEFRKYEDIIEFYIHFQNLLEYTKQLYSYLNLNGSECSLLFCPNVSQKILHIFSSLPVISCILSTSKQKFIISTAFIFSLASQQKISTSIDYTTCYGILLNSSSKGFPILSQYKSSDNMFCRSLIQIGTEFMYRMKVLKQIEIFDFQIYPNDADGYEYKEHPHVFQTLMPTNSLIRYLIFIPVLSPNLLSHFKISHILKVILEGQNFIFIAQNFKFDCNKLYKCLASDIFSADNFFDDFQNLRITKGPSSMYIKDVGKYLKSKTKELIKGIESNLYLLYLNIHYILNFQRIIYDMLLNLTSDVLSESHGSIVDTICLIYSIGAIRRIIELHSTGLVNFLRNYFALEFSEQLATIFLHSNVEKFSEPASVLSGLKSLVTEQQSCGEMDFIPILEAINNFEMLMMMDSSYKQNYFAFANDLLNSKFLIQFTTDIFAYFDAMIDSSVITSKSQFWIDAVCKYMNSMQYDLNGLISFFCIKNRSLYSNTTNSLQVLYFSSETCLRLLLVAIKDKIFPKFLKIPKLKVALTETFKKPDKNKLFKRSFSQPEMNLRGTLKSMQSHETFSQSSASMHSLTQKSIQLSQMKPRSTVKSTKEKGSENRLTPLSATYTEMPSFKSDSGQSSFMNSENLFPNNSDQILLSHLFSETQPYFIGEKLFYIEVFGEKIVNEWLKECKKKLVELDSDKFCLSGFYFKFKIEITLQYHQIRSFLGHTSSFILNKLECYDDLVFCKFMNTYLLNSLKTYYMNIPDSKYIFSVSDESLFAISSKKLEKSSIFNKREFNYHLTSLGLNISYSNLTLLVLLMKCYCEYLIRISVANSESVLGFLTTNNQNLLKSNSISEYVLYLKTIGAYYFIYESCVKSLVENLSLSQSKNSVDFIGSHSNKTFQYDFETNLMKLINLVEDPQLANIFPVLAAASIISDFKRKKSKNLFVDNFGGFISSQHHTLVGIKAFAKFYFKDTQKIDKVLKDILRNIQQLQKSTPKSKHSYLYLYKYFGHSSFVGLI